MFKKLTPYITKTMKSQYTALFALFSLLCISGTGVQADDAPSYGDTIIVGSIGDASNLIHQTITND